MGYDNSFGILDGSHQTLYTAANNLLITDAVIVRRGSGTVTCSIWILTGANKTIPIVTSITLAADTNVINGLKGQALLTGDKVIAKASGSDDLLGDISLSIFGNVLTGTREQLAHLQAQSTYGGSVACGTCATGGKVIEVVDFVPGKTYQIQVVTSGVTITSGKNIQVHYWNQSPNWAAGNPPIFNGRIWLADIPSTGGSFTHTIPSSNFYGYSITAGNPSKSNLWDTLCCTFTTNPSYKITGVGFA